MTPQTPTACPPPWCNGPSIAFTVLGDPRGQPRPRTFTRNGRPMTVSTPKKSPIMVWRDAIRATAERHRPGQPLPGPVWVRLVFRMRRPKGHFGTGRNAERLKPSAPATHTSRPDLDNMIKAVLDALGQLSYWRDDSQIVQVDARKEWGDPGVDVEVAS